MESVSWLVKFFITPALSIVGTEMTCIRRNASEPSNVSLEWRVFMVFTLSSRDPAMA
jgi:hypothetical protein